MKKRHKIRDYRDISENGVLKIDTEFLKAGTKIYQTGKPGITIAKKAKSPSGVKKRKYKRSYMGAEWMKKNEPEEWEKTKQRALAHSRKVNGTTLLIEDVEKEFPTGATSLEIYSRYHREHGITLKQASVYLTHLNRRRKKREQNLKALSIESVKGES